MKKQVMKLTFVCLGLFLLKAGLLGAAALFSAGAAQAEPAAETLRFAVMRDGQQIGSNTIELRRNGPETTVQMVTHVQVKIASVTVYRFKQSETERWVGGKLMALSEGAAIVRQELE